MHLHAVPADSQGPPPLGFPLHGNDKLRSPPKTGASSYTTLNPDELLSITRQRVTRSPTSTECDIYAIDPCPTVEDIRTGS